MTSSVHLVVAVDKNFGIGKNGALPWKLSADLKRFKEITTKTTSPEKQNAVIMGRRTWESLPEKFKPLPQRLNCVLTRQSALVLPTGVMRFSSLTEALHELDSQLGKEVEQVFVIGGGDVYRQCLELNICEKIYLTRVMNSFACDTFFPKRMAGFRKTFQGEPLTEDGVSYRFEEYQRL